MDQSCTSLNLIIVLDGGILGLFANNMITAALWPTEQIPPAARQLRLITVPAAGKVKATLDVWKLQTTWVLVSEAQWHTPPPTRTA